MKRYRVVLEAFVNAGDTREAVEALTLPLSQRCAADRTADASTYGVILGPRIMEYEITEVRRV